MNEKPNRSLYPIVLRTGQSTFVFESAGHLKKWASDHIEFWNTRLALFPTVTGLSDYVERRLRGSGAELMNAAETATESSASSLRILQRAIDVFVLNQTVAYGTPLATYISEIIHGERYGALGLVVLATGMDQEPDLQKVMDSSGNADIPLTVNAGRRVLDDFHKRQSITTAALNAQITSAMERVEGLSEALRSETSRVESVRMELAKLEAVVREQTARLESEVRTFRSNMETSLTQLSVENKARASAVLVEVEASVGPIRDQLEAIRQKSAETEQVAQASANKVADEVGAFLKQGADNLAAGIAAISESFRSRQSQKHPIKFWEDKKFWHRVAAAIYGVLWVIGVVAFIGTPVVEADALFRQVWDEEGNFHNLWPYGISLLYVTVGFWSLRMLAKMFLSAYHLAEDAHEREVMTKGLFSLFADPAAAGMLTKKPFVKVIEILYRPSSKGVIPDDGPGLDLNRIAEALAGKKGG